MSCLAIILRVCRPQECEGPYIDIRDLIDPHPPVPCPAMSSNLENIYTYLQSKSFKRSLNVTTSNAVHLVST